MDRTATPSPPAKRRTPENPGSGAPPVVRAPIPQRPFDPPPTPQPDDEQKPLPADVVLPGADPFDRAGVRLVPVTAKTAVAKPQDDGETVAVKVRRSRPRRWLALGAILAAGVFWYYTVATLVISRAVPLVAGWEASAIISGSMGPVIAPGDVVAFAEYDGKQLGPGTIVSFTDPAHPERSLAHRIVEAREDGSYITKGDANGAPDSTPLQPEAITGVAKLVAPKAGLPMYWWQTGQYTPLFLWFAGLGVSLLLLRVRDPDEGPLLKEIRRRPRAIRPALATMTVGFIAMGALFGWTIASFASSSDNDTNQFEAEAVFGPGHTGVTGAASCGRNSTTVVVAQPVAVGDTVIARLSLRDIRNYTGITASDTAGNVYTLDGTADNGGRVLTAVLSAYVASPLAAGSTITINHHRARASGLTVDAFDDIVPAGRVFAVGSGIGGGSNPSVSVATPAGSAVIIGAVSTRNRATITQPAGWTALQGGTVSCPRRFSQATGHMNTFSAGTATYNPTFNRNRRWAEVVVAYLGT